MPSVEPKAIKSPAAATQEAAIDDYMIEEMTIEEGVAISSLPIII